MTFGTPKGLVLRIMSMLCSSSSLYFMASQANPQLFCVRFAIASMSMVAVWSFILLLAEGFSLFIWQLPRPRKVVILTVALDWILAHISMAAAGQTISVVAFLSRTTRSPPCPSTLCTAYLLSCILGFFSWFFLFVPAVLNF